MILCAVRAPWPEDAGIKLGKRVVTIRNQEFTSRADRTGSRS